MCEFWDWTDKLAKKMQKPQVWWEGDFRKSAPVAEEASPPHQWWKSAKTGHFLTLDDYVAAYPTIARVFWQHNDLEDLTWEAPCFHCGNFFRIDREKDPKYWRHINHLCPVCDLGHP